MSKSIVSKVEQLDAYNIDTYLLPEWLMAQFQLCFSPRIRNEYSSELKLLLNYFIFRFQIFNFHKAAAKNIKSK